MSFGGSFSWAEKSSWDEKLWRDVGYCWVMLLLMVNRMGSCHGRVAYDKASQRRNTRKPIKFNKDAIATVLGTNSEVEGHASLALDTPAMADIIL